MRILITGSKGQLGSELQKQLFELKKHEITAVDIDTLDITDINAVRAFAKDYDVIINSAAFTAVDKCEEEPEIAFKVNAIGAKNLAIVAEEIGAKLVHISTDYVFNGKSKVPFKEWDNINPESVYGKSKALGEEYVKSFCKKYFIIRTAWLYGYIGGNFVKTMMRVMRENGKAKVVNDQFGNPTSVTDLSWHILKIIETEHYGIFHGTNNGVCSWYDFTLKIAEFANIKAEITPCTTEEFPRPAKRPEYSALDNMAFRCTIGDNFRPWEEALKEYIENLEA